MTERRKAKAKGGAKDSPTRSIILHVTERLLLDEGYGAITSRRVAKEAGMTSALIHYYFPTTDDLLMEVYNQAQKKFRRRLDRALRTEKPLSALWKALTHTRATALSVELIALANHRKAISVHMSADMRDGREKQAQKLQEYLGGKSGAAAGVDALSLLLGLIGFARLIVVDQSLGADLGHEKLKQHVENYIREIEEA